MLDHKQPGKGSSTSAASAHAHGPDHGPDHGPGPGKHSRVEQAQARAPIASAASVSTSASGSISFNEGNVKINETVSLKLSAGRGPVAVNLQKGGIQVGNDHMSFDVHNPAAATGKHLALGGASTTIAKGHTHEVQGKMEGGYFGVEYTTSWDVSGHGWKATLSVSAFMGTRPPPPEHHGVIGKIVHAVEHAVVAVAKEIAKDTAAIVKSAPKWGPYVAAAVAAVAASGEAVVTG